ncbi:MAG: hypothetical protein HYR66_18265, partial [Sphingobacteriales bacterium]|nr:hypothetical protein [Sphingobacteriales bacterium]
MKFTRIVTAGAIICLAIVSGMMLLPVNRSAEKKAKKNILPYDNEENELLEEGGKGRQMYEFKLLRDPHTGTIPADIRKKELA